MDIDPMEYVGDDADEPDTPEEKAEAKAKEKGRSRLNTLVAVTVALLATFMGVCKVKDDNLVQAMQQEQAKSIDAWSWYQARKIRTDMAQATAVQLRLQALSAPPAARTAYQQQITAYTALAAKEGKKSQDTQNEATGHDKQYDAYNYHDDQFDLSDAALSLAIALMAMTSLTQKRWLYGIALVPMAIGVLMGLAGLFNWHIHSDLMAKLLGT